MEYKIAEILINHTDKKFIVRFNNNCTLVGDYTINTIVEKGTFYFCVFPNIIWPDSTVVKNHVVDMPTLEINTRQAVSDKLVKQAEELFEKHFESKILKPKTMSDGAN